jgi:glutaredoxin-like YruB-family protein
MVTKKVKLFTTPYCTYCKLAKDFFVKNKIDYTEVDVTKDEKALNEMIKKSGQMAVPVIEVDNEVLVGFNETKLKKLLGVK